MKNSKTKVFFVIALMAAVWFLLSSWCWFYILNIWLSFPFGILALILWKKGTKAEPSLTRFKVIPIILTLGVLSSLISMAYLIWFR